MSAGQTRLTAAGILLLINIPAAWFNFKYIQAQILMTSGMILCAICDDARDAGFSHRCGFSLPR